jgi:Uma2 family endonuclease
MTAPAFREHPRLWTADQFLDFYASRPQGERWQLVDGLAMMMVPPNLVHQRISGNLERLLNDALEAHSPDLYAYRKTGVRIPGVIDFNPEPDVVVLPAEADYRYYADAFFLVAEVLSSFQHDGDDRAQTGALQKPPGQSLLPRHRSGRDPRGAARAGNQLAEDGADRCER